MLLYRQGNRRSASQRGVRAGAQFYFLLSVHLLTHPLLKFEYNSRRQQKSQQQQTRIRRPQPAPPPPPHAPQPISQRVEGIVSPETSPELSPTDFQVDLEAGIRHPHPRLPLPPPTQTLRRQESSEINPFLPDLDPEPEQPAAQSQRGYDVGHNSEDSDEEEEGGLGASALFPGSDIF